MSKCTETDLHNNFFQRSKKEQKVGSTAESVAGIIFLHTPTHLFFFFFKETVIFIYLYLFYVLGQAL